MEEKKQAYPSVYLTDVDIRKNGRCTPLLCLTELIVLLLYGFGLLLTLRSALLLPVQWELFFITALLPALAVLRFRLKRFGWAIGLALFISVGICAFCLRELLALGALVLRNGVAQSINAYFFTAIPLEALTATMSGLRGATDLIYSLILLLFIWIGGYAVVRGRSAVALLLLETPFLWAAVNLGEQPHGFPLALFLLALSSLLAMHAAQSQPRRRDPAGSFSVVRRKGSVLRRLTASPLRAEGIAKNGRRMLLCSAALLFAITAVFPRESFVRPPILQKFDQNPQGFFKKYSVADLLGGAVTGGIAEGKLGRADRIEYAGKVDFVVRRLRDLDTPLYLRGYVGSVYTGSSWDILSPREYQGQEWLGRYTPQLFPGGLAGYINAVGENGFGQGESMLEIMPLAQNPAYLLLPYGATNSGGGKYYYDSYQTGEGDNYQVKGYFQRWFSTAWDGRPVNLPLDGRLPALAAGYYAAENASVSEAIRSYGAFAREMYTRLPEAWTKENAYGLPTLSGISLERLIPQVQDYLSAAASYNIAPGKTPMGKDFAAYFLTESKSGYCSHYATAATIMFRRAGVPARYVEGYRLGPTLLHQAQNGILEVTDEYAHAWTEIYVEPFGWIPVEVTPGAGEPGYIPPASGEDSRPEDVVSSEEAASPESGVSSEETASSESGAPSEAPSGGNSSASSSEEAEGGAPSQDTPSANGVTSEGAGEVDSSPPQSSGAGAEDSSPAGRRASWWAVIPLGILLCLLAGLTLYLRRWLLLGRRERSFGQADRSRAALEVYGYILRLLAEQGLVPGEGEPPAGFAERAAAGLHDGAAGGFARITALAERAKYSRTMLGEAELAEMEVFAKTLRRRILASKGRFARLSAKWIKVLW